MNNATYCQRIREIALNKAKDYNKNNNERLKKQARDKYRNLSEEGKIKKRYYGKNRYHNMSEEKKQKLKEYQKQKHQEAKKSKNNNNNKILHMLFSIKLLFIINIRFCFTINRAIILFTFFLFLHQYNFQFLSFLENTYILLKVFEVNTFYLL